MGHPPIISRSRVISGLIPQFRGRWRCRQREHGEGDALTLLRNSVKKEFLFYLQAMGRRIIHLERLVHWVLQWQPPTSAVTNAVFASIWCILFFNHVSNPIEVKNNNRRTYSWPPGVSSHSLCSPHEPRPPTYPRLGLSVQPMALVSKWSPLKLNLLTLRQDWYSLNISAHSLLSFSCPRRYSKSD